ncbi:hypothetical protein QE370_000444 [Aeromicrobium sp. SORGH_AS981]|nr:hypothetical protein [Aeromicrobium sp. SORGH_AS_0981]
MARHNNIGHCHAVLEVRWRWLRVLTPRGMDVAVSRPWRALWLVAAPVLNRVTRTRLVAGGCDECRAIYR